MIAALVLLALFALSLLFNLGSIASLLVGESPSSIYGPGPRLQEVVLEDQSARDKIAVLEISGIIIGGAYGQGGHSIVDVIKAQLARAKEDTHVRAVILKVDSPGGEVLASDEIYQLVETFQKDTGKPVVASMGGVAASGGYYVSAPCRWIVANELTITGSIGVIMQSFNYRGLMNKVGVQPQTYKSGRFKDMLSGSREPGDISPEEQQMVQTLIDEVYARFRDVVAAGRKKANELNRDAGRNLRTDWKEFADGRILSGNEAYRLGLVDELGNFQTALRRTLKLADVSKANLVTYEQIVTFSDFLRMFGQSEARVVKLDVGLEVPKLKAGQPYFLSPNYVQ